MRIHTYSSVTTSCVVCFYTIFFICLLVWLFVIYFFFFFFSSRRRHTRLTCDWSSDVCSSDLGGRTGYIQPVAHAHHITLDALQGIDVQKGLIDQNTRQFVHGHPANNVLLTGARGTGKSSLVKAMLTKYAASGLRLIEVEKHDLTDLHDIVEQIFQRPERFILYCDDLSFESGEAGYKTLKVVLDGSIATASENVLIYATSNRRHLMPEFMQD